MITTDEAIAMARECGGYAPSEWSTQLTLYPEELTALCNLAYQKGLEDAGKWISVEDRLPDADMKQVFAWDSIENRATNCSFLYGWESFRRHPYLTHWMPLPSAPKGQPE